MPDAREALREKVARAIFLHKYPGSEGAWDVDGDQGKASWWERADVLMPLFASVWEDGARWGAVEFGRIEDESRVQLAPSDNPYMKGDLP